MQETYHLRSFIIEATPLFDAFLLTNRNVTIIICWWAETRAHVDMKKEAAEHAECRPSHHHTVCKYTRRQ